MSSKPPSPPNVIRTQGAGRDGTPVVFADQPSGVHIGSLTAKLNLSVEVAPGRREHVQTLVIPTHELFALATNLIALAFDRNFQPVVDESVPLARAIDKLKAKLAELPIGPVDKSKQD